ncbi:MAG: hypothetical protein R3B90_07395 [Planctomycetaceae bacterium]
MSHAYFTPDRSPRGHIIVLPGIEGESQWNHRIVRGLVGAGLGHSIEIHDWTYGRWLALYSLRAKSRHRSQAELIAEKVCEVRQRYPAAPVWLIGHSGGGAMSVLSLECLPVEVQATGAILLGPALSRGYDLGPALQATERGIWNFSSICDALYLIFGTMLMGTLDGRHQPSAGAIGFRRSTPQPTGATIEPANVPPRLTQVPWRPRMIRDWHLGGHFGPVSPKFVERWIAPIIEAVPAGDATTATAAVNANAYATPCRQAVPA